MGRRTAVQIQFDKDCSAMLKAAAEAGFEHVSIGFGSYEGFVREGWQERIAALRDEIAVLGLTCVMTHAPYYDLRISADVTIPAIDLSVSRCIEATAMLGAEIMAIHPRGCYVSGSPYEGSVKGFNLSGLMTDRPGGCFSDGIEELSRSVELNVSYWKPFCERAAELGVLVGVENLPRWPNWNMTFCSNDPGAHAEIIDCLGEGACGVWDFGHAYLTNQGDVGPLKRLGSRIKGLHVHDNKGVDDNHFIPFDGSMNWQEQMGALKETGFDGYITLELAYTCDKDIGGFLSHAHSAAVRLDEILRS